MARADLNRSYLAYQALSTFSNSTLSSFYFDVTKDTLYADSRTSLDRRQVVYTLQKVSCHSFPRTLSSNPRVHDLSIPTLFVQVFDTYLSVLSPLAPLLAEEIYHFSSGASKDPVVESERQASVFEKIWPTPVSSTVFPSMFRIPLIDSYTLSLIPTPYLSGLKLEQSGSQEGNG